VKYSPTRIRWSAGLQELSRLAGNNFDLLRSWNLENMAASSEGEYDK